MRETVYTSEYVDCSELADGYDDSYELEKFFKRKLEFDDAQELVSVCPTRDGKGYMTIWKREISTRR